MIEGARTNSVRATAAMGGAVNMCTRNGTASEGTALGDFPLMRTIERLYKSAGRPPARTSVEALCDKMLQDLKMEMVDLQRQEREELRAIKEKFTGGLDVLNDRIEHLNATLNSSDCLPIERASKNREIETLTKLAKSVRGLRSQIDSNLGASKNCATAFHSVLDQFPNAEVLDLSCLFIFKLKNGLPALALFDVGKEEAVIRLDCPSYNRYDHSGSPEVKASQNNSSVFQDSEPFSKYPLEFRELFVGICNATGVIPVNRHNLRGKTFECLGIKESKDYYTVADSIIVSASFPPGEIPTEAKQLIKKAENRGSPFHAVCVLAEVPEWNVTYVALNDGEPTPRIKGKVLPARRVASPDPLIVGFKHINDRLVAFLLGAFNTTGLEDWLLERSKTVSVQPLSVEATILLEDHTVASRA